MNLVILVIAAILSLILSLSETLTAAVFPEVTSLSDWRMIAGNLGCSFGFCGVLQAMHAKKDARLF